MSKSDLQTRLEEQLREKGIPDYVGYAQKLLEDRGHIAKGTTDLTDEGTLRNDMGNEGRALDRHGKHGDYDPNTNRVGPV